MEGEEKMNCRGVYFLRIKAKTVLIESMLSVLEVKGQRSFSLLSGDELSEADVLDHLAHNLVFKFEVGNLEL